MVTVGMPSQLPSCQSAPRGEFSKSENPISRPLQVEPILVRVSTEVLSDRY